jgi:hypothetical protein
MWMTFGLACCAVEMMQMSMPRYDCERFVICRKVGSLAPIGWPVAGSRIPFGWGAIAGARERVC